MRVRVRTGPLLLQSKGRACWPGQTRSCCKVHRCRSLFKRLRGGLRAQVRVAARTSASRGRARLMGTLHLDAAQQRAAAAHLRGSAAACLLAALLLCGAACTDAAMGVSAVRPSALARTLLVRLATR